MAATNNISPLQLMQARFQRKLIEDKRQMMMQLYPETGSAPERSRGGAVRQLFAQRRAHTKKDEADLLSSSGLISLQQNLANSWPTTNFKQGPKQGSPVGWDKSYPLSPLDRDSSGSSGHDSTGAPHHKKNQLSVAGPHKPTRRTPSLDRYANAKSHPHKKNAMRRSNSQILLSSNGNGSGGPKEKENQAQPNFLQRLTRNAQKKPPAMASSKVAPVPVPTHKPVKMEELPAVKLVTKSKKPVVPAIQPKPLLAPAKPVGGAVSPKRPPAAHPPSTNTDPNLKECGVCGRRFALNRLEKHEAVCHKTKQKKRKVFDPTKMRTQGTELEEYVRVLSAKPPSTQPETQVKKDWRVKRNNFIESLRQAKMVQKHLAAGGNIADLPPPVPMDTSDYVQCPHCDRKFSEGAAERHIPKCQNIKSNKRLDRR